jgi:hypothetical protein
MSNWDMVASLFDEWKEVLTRKTSCSGLDKILLVAPTSMQKSGDGRNVPHSGADSHG